MSVGNGAEGRAWERDAAEAGLPTRQVARQARAERSSEPTIAAAKFVGRVAQVEVAGIRDVVDTWHRSMRDGADAWFAAEHAVARAVLDAARSAEQAALVEHMTEAFRRAAWSRSTGRLPRGAPEPRGGTIEATGQYLATVAMLALLARDHLDPRAFDLLYHPFASQIPASELARE